MKAIQIHGRREISVDEMTIPQIEHPDDAIIKVELAGLCGSDLHVYRLHEGTIDAPFIMGHELFGKIIALGSNFISTQSDAKVTGRPSGYSECRIGMKVISAFSISCLECPSCLMGWTSRCTHSQLLGSPSLPGAQGQFVRIPKAGGTLIPIPSPSPSDPTSTSHLYIQPEHALLLADILPTGYFAVKQAIHHPNLAPLLNPSVMKSGIGFVDAEFSKEIAAIATTNRPAEVNIALIGLGPVGLCALVALVDMIINLLDSSPSQLRFKITSIDLLESRRNRAKEIVVGIDDKRIGTTSASSIHVEFISSDEAIHGAYQAILEIVGHPSSLLLASQLASPFAVISSVGVHTFKEFGIQPAVLYNKNLSFAFGRCPVRALLPASRALLSRRAKCFEGFVERVVGMSNEHAVKEAYEKFDKGESGKIAFDPWA